MLLDIIVRIFCMFNLLIEFMSQIIRNQFYLVLHDPKKG